MKIISATEINQLLEYPALVEALRVAFMGGITTPPRHHHAVENDGTLLLMPSFNKQYLGTKIVSVFPHNTDHGLPAVQGNYFLSSGKTGEALALIEGKTLTTWRTAAASALASSYLSRKDSKTLLMVGAGALALPLIKAHLSVRPIEKILLWNRNIESSRKLQSQLNIDCEIVNDLEQAVGLADIISCATLSQTPLIKGVLLREGTHIDLVGGFTPKMREADDDCVTRASLFVDTYAGGLHEAGDIVEPLSRGIISHEDVKSDLFGLCQEKHIGRISESEITLFKSVGTALEDLAAAILVYESA